MIANEAIQCHSCVISSVAMHGCTCVRMTGDVGGQMDRWECCCSSSVHTERAHGKALLSQWVGGGVEG